MKLGMPALLEHEHLEQSAALCRELGLDFVELNLNLPGYQPGRADAAEIRRVGEKYGISWSVHLDENLNLFEFNPMVADAWKQTLLSNIALAKQIGARVLNMHFNRGVVFTLPERKVYVFEKFLPEYQEGLRSIRKICEEAIGDSGIRICMENSKTYFDFQKQALDLLLESPVFALTLDVGHNHCSGYSDEAWIRQREIRHMHLHDARGTKHDHQPLGQGEMNIPAYLALAKERDCTVLLEVKTLEGLRQSVAWLRETNRW